MNFDEAVTAHSQWRIRLRSVVEQNSREMLDPQVVGTDDKCILGQWIHGDARTFGALKEYEELVQEHARFHTCAAEVLRLALAGDRQKAGTMLDTGGAFMAASIRTINAIRHLRRVVEKG